MSLNVGYRRENESRLRDVSVNWTRSRDLNRRRYLLRRGQTACSAYLQRPCSRFGILDHDLSLVRTDYRKVDRGRKAHSARTGDAHPDVQGHPEQAAIEAALKSRLIDTFADGTFRPNSTVTREDLARSLALNTSLRQTLGSTPKFGDISGDLRLFAEYSTARGSTNRDFDFIPTGMIAASGTSFNPAGSVNRLDLAVALVKALGHDAAARALANTTVTSNGTALSDNAQIPGSLRGYVQIAINKGLFEAFPAEVREIAPGQFVAIPGPRFEPATTVSRAVLAGKLNTYRTLFTTGG